MVASGGIPLLLEALKVVLAMSFVGYSVYFYNDIIDLEDDLRNKELGNPAPSSRPLGSGRVSMSRMWKFTIFSAIVGLFIAFTISIQVFILQLIFLVLGILYSTEPVRLKRRTLGKQAIIMAGGLMATISGALTLGIINTRVLYFILLNVLLNGILSPTADLRDIRGDRISEMKTIPILWGPEMTVRLILGVLVAIEVATLIGYSRLGFTVAMPILFTVIIVTLIYVVFPLLRRWNDPIYLNIVIFKKIFPLYILLHIPAYIGVLTL